MEDEGAGFDTRGRAGAGRLGLASVRERAELVGGRVLIESVPGAGTRAIVEVPDRAEGAATGGAPAVW